MPSIRRQVPYGAIAAALYVLSLMTPAVVLDGPLLWGSPKEHLIFGIHCLIFGWGTIAWYANVLLWVAAVALAYQRPSVAAVASLLACALALTTFFYVGDLIRAPHAGYFAWLASMILVLVAACARPARATSGA